MRFIIRFSQALRADVRVNLSRRQTLVAEQFLNASNVRPSVKQVCGKAMAQRMWAGASIETCLADVFFEHATNAAGRQSIAEFIDEGRAFSTFGLSR